MFLLTLLALIVAVYFLAAGLWLFVISLYFIGGLLWILNERRRPPLYRPMAYMSASGIIFIFIFWPIRVINDLFETWKIRRSSERYVVIGEGEIKKFAHWHDALQAAIREAKTTQQRVMISDEAKFAKQLGRFEHKSWFVEPDGSLNSLPRNFL